MVDPKRPKQNQLLFKTIVDLITQIIYFWGMIIHITPDEFEPEFQEAWKQNLIKSPMIDYATNAIHGWFEDKDVIIFRFKGYGFINDNRHSTRELSIGAAGITLLITKTTEQ